MHINPENVDGVVGRLLANGFVEVQLADGAVFVCFLGPELRATGAVVREGDRVVVAAAENGVFRGEIRRIRPDPRAPREPAPERASLIATPDSGKLKPADQKVDRHARPGWLTGAECAPQVGDEVYCTAGVGTVLRVLGRTGNGSRLLELRLPANAKVSFFASGSNVLLAPRPGMALAAGAAAS